MHRYAYVRVRARARVSVCCEIKLEDVPEMGYASVCIRAEP